MPLLLSEKAPASPSSSECANCGICKSVEGSQLSSCARCQAVKYCGKVQQRQHLSSSGHKKFCLTPSRLTSQLLCSVPSCKILWKSATEATLEEQRPREILFDPRGTRESLPSNGTGKSSTEDVLIYCISLDKLDAVYGATTILLSSRSRR